MSATTGPNRGVVLAAWVASTALAFVWGHSAGVSRGREEAAAQQARATRADQNPSPADTGVREPQSTGPDLQGVAPRSQAASAVLPDRPTAGSERFVPGGDLVRRLMDSTSALLAHGASGHAALLRFLCGEAEDGELLAWFYSDRPMYVVAKGEWEAFVAARDAEWTAFLVATLDGMSHRPEEYEESVVESEFLVHQFARLPGALPADRIEALTSAMRSAVGRWPSLEPDRGPAARGFLDDVLVTWVPSIPPARALALLRGGGLSRRETLELLRSVREAGIPAADLSTVLASLAAYDGDAFWAGVASAPWAIPQDAVDTTDRIVLEDATNSPYTDYAKQRLAPYLRRTARAGWPAARPIVEQGLTGGGRTPERFADLLGYLDPKPDRAYVQWVLSRFALPPEIAAQLRSDFFID